MAGSADAQPARDGDAGAADRPPIVYDAFLSYSFGLDGKLAPALQNSIERYAKPWYKLRSLRIFRDTANLSVSPDLWIGIEDALRRSRYLILLASPAAAQSKWVRREIRYWLSKNALSTILVVLTDGRVAWDEQVGDFDWQASDALPPELRGAFAQEPLYVDLRWARKADVHLSLSNPLFAQAILSLSARIHGKPMDELGGESVRNHRIVRRLAGGAASTIAGLAVGAFILAWFATKEATRADERTQDALRRESLRLAFSSRSETASGNATGGISLALRALPSQFDVVGRWAFWTTGRKPDRPVVPEAVGALAEALTLQREERVFGPRADTADERYVASGFLEAGAKVYGVTSSGRFRSWVSATGEQVADLQSPSSHPKFVSFDADGSRAILADDKGDLIYWLPGSLPDAVKLPLRSPERDGMQDRILVSWSARQGRLVLVPPAGPAALYEVPSGRLLKILAEDAGKIGFVAILTRQDRSIIRMLVEGNVKGFDSFDGAPTDPGEEGLTSTDPVLESRDGNTIVTLNALGTGGATVWAREDQKSKLEVSNTLELGSRDRLVMSQDGRLLAKATPQGGIEISRSGSRIFVKMVSAAAPVAAMEFDGNGKQLLVSLDAGALVLFRAAPSGWFDGFSVTPGPGYSGLLARDGSRIVAGALGHGTRFMKGIIASWDIVTGEEGKQLFTGSWPVFLRSEPDERRLAAVLANGEIRIWGISSSAYSIPPLAGDGGNFVDVAFVGNERLFGATARGTVVSYKAANGAEIERQDLGAGNLQGLAAAPGADTLVAAFRDDPAVLWQAGLYNATRRAVPRVDGHVRRVAVSADRFALGTEGGDVYLFDTAAAKLTRTLSTRGEPINSLAFDNQGGRLAAATAMGNVWIWGLASAEDDLVLRQGNARLYSASFAPDGRKLLTTGHDGKARLWWVGKSTDDLVSLARPRQLRCLGPEKASFYGIEATAPADHDPPCFGVRPSASLEPSE